MEDHLEKGIIAGVVAFLRTDKAAVRKILAELLKDAGMRAQAKAIMATAEKQADTPGTKEPAAPAQPEAPASADAQEERQRKRDLDRKESHFGKR